MQFPQTWSFPSRLSKTKPQTGHKGDSTGKNLQRQLEHRKGVITFSNVTVSISYASAEEFSLCAGFAEG